MSDGLQALVRGLTSRSRSRAVGGALLALPVGETSLHYVALNSELAPVVLIHSPTVVGGIVPPLRLRGIEVAYGVRCNLELPDGKVAERILSTVACTTSDQMERLFFLDSCEMLLRQMGEAPPLDVVIAATQHLANVFQRLASPARESVTGVIGELLVIDLSPNPHVAIEAWRQRPEDRFDFSLDNVRLEVKSSSGRSRIHHLTHEQCTPPDGTIGLLASVVIESAGGGQSLLELLESIEARVGADPPTLYRFREVIADTLGDTLIQSLTERFDRLLAESSVMLYDLRAIPAIRGQLPRGVTHLKFQSDVSLASAVNAGDYVSACPRIGNLLRL